MVEQEVVGDILPSLDSLSLTFSLDLEDVCNLILGILVICLVIGLLRFGVIYVSIDDFKLRRFFVKGINHQIEGVIHIIHWVHLFLSE
jgi:hypothetical protein